MERLDRNVRAFQAAFEQRLEILNAIRVNVAINVLFRVINDVMNVLFLQ